MRGQGATWTSPPPSGFANIIFKEGSDLILKVRGFCPAGLLSIVNGWLFICAGCPPQVNTKFATPCISALSLTVAVTAWAALHVRTPPDRTRGRERRSIFCQPRSAASARRCLLQDGVDLQGPTEWCRLAAGRGRQALTLFGQIQPTGASLKGRRRVLPQ